MVYIWYNLILKKYFVGDRLEYQQAIATHTEEKIMILHHMDLSNINVGRKIIDRLNSKFANN